MEVSLVLTVVVGALTFFNVALLALNLKIYTEIFKQKAQESRHG